MWIGVTRRFGQFHKDLMLTKPQSVDGLTKQLGVRESLHRAYWGELHNEPPLGFLVGSWGKQTQVRPPKDIDLFFPLPPAVFSRVNGYAERRQTALLQEVRGQLASKYSRTEIRGDGQVVVVEFGTVVVEVVPVFSVSDGEYLMPDTNDGGHWKVVAPFAELALIELADARTNGNVRALVQMVKTWKRDKDVRLKSYQVELLMVEFLAHSPYGANGYFWYDWLIRDFFIFLCTKHGSSVTIPGTGEKVNLGDAWLPKATSARDIALVACDYEYNDWTHLAGEEWQKIFGPTITVA